MPNKYLKDTQQISKRYTKIILSMHNKISNVYTTNIYEGPAPPPESGPTLAQEFMSMTVTQSNE
jgi:hypothetical protein